MSGSLREIVDVVSKVQGGEQHLFDSPDAYLFPLALGQPGHLHIVYNSLEHGVKSLKVWSEMEPILRDITNFLGDKGLRRRFCSKCLPSSLQKLFSTWSARHIDWKWEFLSTFLDEFRLKLPLLLKHFVFGEDDFEHGW